LLPVARLVSVYTIPGLVLVIVVGGITPLAASIVFIERTWVVLVSLLASMLMADNTFYPIF